MTSLVNEILSINLISSFKLIDNSLILVLISFSKCSPLKSKKGKKNTFSIPFF